MNDIQFEWDAGKDLKPNTPLIAEESAIIEAAKKMPIIFDEDSPELVPETRDAFRQAAVERNARMKRQASGS